MSFLHTMYDSINAIDQTLNDADYKSETIKVGSKLLDTLKNSSEKSNLDINVTNEGDGNSALHVAILHQWPELVAELIKEGADVKVADNNGKTPLVLTLTDEYIDQDIKYEIAQELFKKVDEDEFLKAETLVNSGAGEHIKKLFQLEKSFRKRQIEIDAEENDRRLALSKIVDEIADLEEKKLTAEKAALETESESSIKASQILKEAQDKAAELFNAAQNKSIDLKTQYEAEANSILEKAREESAKLKNEAQGQADELTKIKKELEEQQQALKDFQQEANKRERQPEAGSPTNSSQNSSEDSQPGSTSTSKLPDLKVYTKINIDSLFPKVSKDNKPHENQDLLNASLAWHYFTTKSELPNDKNGKLKEVADFLNNFKELREQGKLAELRQQIVGYIEQRNTSGGEYRPAGQLKKPEGASEEHYPGLPDSHGKLEYFSFNVGKDKSGAQIQLDLAVTEEGQVHVAEESLRKIKLSGLTLSVKIPGDNDGEHEYLEFVNGQLMFIDHGPDSGDKSRLTNLKAAIHEKDREVERDLSKAAKSIKEALIEKKMKHQNLGESFSDLRDKMEEYDKLRKEELIKYDKLKAEHEAKISLEEKSLTDKDYPKQISLIDSNIGNLTKSFVETSNAINSINLKANEVNKEKNKVNKQINSTNQQIHDINHERDKISATIDSLNEIIQETELKRRTDKYGNETVTERSNRWQKSLLGLGKNSRYLLGLVSNAAKNANQREDHRLEAHKEIKELQDGLKELNGKSEKLSENLKKQTERNKLLDVEADRLNNKMIILSKKSSNLSDQITSQNQKKSQLQDENSEHQNKILKLNLVKDGDLEVVKKKINKFSQDYEKVREPYLEYKRRESMLIKHLGQQNEQGRAFTSEWRDNQYWQFTAEKKMGLLDHFRIGNEIEVSPEEIQKLQKGEGINYRDISISQDDIENLNLNRDTNQIKITGNPAILIEADKRIRDVHKNYLVNSQKFYMTDDPSEKPSGQLSLIYVDSQNSKLILKTATLRGVDEKDLSDNILSEKQRKQIISRLEVENGKKKALGELMAKEEKDRTDTLKDGKSYLGKPSNAEGANFAVGFGQEEQDIKYKLEKYIETVFDKQKSLKAHATIEQLKNFKFRTRGSVNLTVSN